MSKSYKLNYNQYKHLIDVFTTGDFLNESLDKSVGSITYRKLLTEDNILYFTKNTRRTCRVPLGIQKRDEKFKFIDLMERAFTYRHSDVNVLNNFAKLTLCYLMQSYRPDEYEVYSDLNLEEFRDLENLHIVSSVEELDSIYSNYCTERHRKYFDKGVYTYKEFRKTGHDKLIIFIINNPINIKLLKSISNNSLKDGMSILVLEQSDISNNSTISLDNTVRPNISSDDLKIEVEIYKRMLGEYDNMINQINLLTGEILNEGELHEQLVVNLPEPENGIQFIPKRKKVIEDTKEVLGEIEELKYSIYNMREYGYQFGGRNANGDYGSFHHHLLKDSANLSEEALRYIIRASIYTLFSHSSYVLNSVLWAQGDLSNSDKTILDGYADRQVKHYLNNKPWFKAETFDEDCDDSLCIDKIFYSTCFCTIELKNKRLFVKVNGKEKKLPDGLLYYVDLDNEALNFNLTELIVRYELYLEYGTNTPSDIYGIWYTDTKYIRKMEIPYNTAELPSSRRFN